MLNSLHIWTYLYPFSVLHIVSSIFYIFLVSNILYLFISVQCPTLWRRETEDVGSKAPYSNQFPTGVFTFIVKRETFSIPNKNNVEMINIKNHYGYLHFSMRAPFYKLVLQLFIALSCKFKICRTKCNLQVQEEQLKVGAKDTLCKRFNMTTKQA